MCESEVLLSMMGSKMFQDNLILKHFFAKKYCLHNKVYWFSLDSSHGVTTQLLSLRFKCLFTLVLLPLGTPIRTHSPSLSSTGSCDLTLRPCVCSAAGRAPEAPKRRKQSDIDFHWSTRHNPEPWLLPTNRSFPPLVLCLICSWKTLAFQEVAWTSFPLLLFPRNRRHPPGGPQFSPSAALPPRQGRQGAELSGQRLPSPLLSWCKKLAGTNL